MKAVLLLFTILFATSVLADCCNFEVEVSDPHCSVFEESSSDGCGDGADHPEELQHCHCSPVHHFKILTGSSVKLLLPASRPSVLFPTSVNLLISHFVSRIFHPPIA